MTSTKNLSPLHSYEPIEVLERCELTGRELVVRLPTSHLAWYQRRAGPMLRTPRSACLLQVPLEDRARSLRLDDRLAAGDDPDVIGREARAELDRWFADRGWRLVRHSELPIGSGGWIGVSAGGDEPFDDHVVVMTEDRLVFDPASNWPAPMGYRVDRNHTITSGWTIERISA